MNLAVLSCSRDGAQDSPRTACFAPAGHPAFALPAGNLKITTNQQLDGSRTPVQPSLPVESRKSRQPLSIRSANRVDVIAPEFA